MGVGKSVRKTYTYLQIQELSPICFGQVGTDYIIQENQPILPSKKPDFTVHLAHSDLQTLNFQNTKNCKRKSDTLACITPYTTSDTFLKGKVHIV